MPLLLFSLLGIGVAALEEWPFHSSLVPLGLAIAAIAAIASWWQQRPYVRAVQVSDWRKQTDGNFQLAITRRDHGKSSPRASVIGRDSGTYIGYRIGIEYEADGTVLLVADPPIALTLKIV